MENTTAGNHIVRSFDEDLQSLAGLTAEMGGLVERQIELAIGVLEGRDVTIGQAEASSLDAEVDLLEEQIDQEAVRLLAVRQPLAQDLRFIAMSLKISNNLERAGDHAVSAAKKAARLREAGLDAGSMRSLARLGEGVHAMLRDILDAFVRRDAARAKAVWERDAEIDRAYEALAPQLAQAVADAGAGAHTLWNGLFVAKNIERIGDHATNIAEKIFYIVDGQAINLQRRG